MRALPLTRVSAAALAALLVAGCAATPLSLSSGAPVAAATPSATAAPTAPPRTATPEPSAPPDVTKAFVRRLTDPAFEGAGPVTGSMTLGALEGTITGSHQVRGGDTTLDLAFEIPGVVASRSSTITLDGRSFTSADGGPWFESPATATDSDFGGSMALAAASVVDHGIVDRNGEPLHHLVPTSGAFTGADLGLTDDLADAAGTMEFYARDDGSLAALSLALAWEISSGSQSLDASIEFDMGFEPDPAVAIEAPEDLWVRHTSERDRYTIGAPAGWQRVDAGANGDLYGATATEFTGVMRERQPKAADGDLDAYVRAFVAANRRETGGRPTSSEATTALGGPAWRLRYESQATGEPAIEVYTLLIRGRDAYWIGTIGPSSREAEVTALHERQLGTFQVLGG